MGHSSIDFLASIFEGSPFGRFLNKLLDSPLIQMIESFSLSDSCQVINTELEAEFFEILRKQNT